MKTCHQCGVKLKPKFFMVFDNKKKKCGEYCSGNCAHDDAWGPRFRPRYYIIPVGFKKMSQNSNNKRKKVNYGKTEKDSME